MPGIEELQNTNAIQTWEQVAKEKPAEAVAKSDSLEEAQVTITALRGQYKVVLDLYKKGSRAFRNRVCPIKEAYETTLLELGRIYGEEK